MSMLKELKGLSERRAAAIKAFEEEAQKVVAPTLKAFIVAHPNIKAFGWTQYTPYWNDGEECIFRLNEVAASVLDERDDDSLYGDGWEEVYSYSKEIPEGFSKEDWKDLVELNSVLSS